MLSVLGSFYFRITALAILDLVSTNFELVDLQDVHIKSSNLASSIFKPKDVQAPIDIQIILLGIAFEQFSLGCNVVLLFFFFLFVNEVVHAACSMGALSQVRWYTDVVLITLRPVHLLGVRVIQLFIRWLSLNIFVGWLLLTSIALSM